MPSPESRVDLAQAADALASEVDRLLDHGRVDGDWTDLEGALDSLRSALRASTEGAGEARARKGDRAMMPVVVTDDQDWPHSLIVQPVLGGSPYAVHPRDLAPDSPTGQGGAEARSDRPAWGGIQVSPNPSNYLDDPAPADPTPREGDAQVDLAERISEMAIEFGLLNSALAAEDWNAAVEPLTALANLGLNDPRPLLARALTSEPAQPDQGSDPSRVDEADVEIVRHAERTAEMCRNSPFLRPASGEASERG